MAYKTLIMFLDRLPTESDETEQTLNMITFAADGNNELVFRQFTNDSDRNFCERSYMTLIRHLKQKRTSLTKQNFGEPFFSLFVRRLERLLNILNSRIGPEEGSVSIQDWSKAFENIFFLLFECHEVVGQTRSFPSDSINATLLRVFPRLDQMKQISLITKLCFLIDLFERKFPGLAVRLKNLMVGLYFNNFNDSEIRTFLCYNILEFSKEKPQFVENRVLDFYTGKYIRRASTFRLTNPDYTLLESLIRNFGQQGATKTVELGKFFENLSGVFGWQFIFFHPVYVAFVDNWWSKNGPLDVVFCNYWEQFFNRLTDCSHQIIKGKKNEFGDSVRVELVPNLLLLKSLLRTNCAEQLKEKLRPLCAKVEQSLLELHRRIRKNMFYDSPDHNQFFKIACKMIDYELKEPRKEPKAEETVPNQRAEEQQIDKEAVDNGIEAIAQGVEEAQQVFLRQDSSQAVNDLSAESLELFERSQKQVKPATCTGFFAESREDCEQSCYSLDLSYPKCTRNKMLFRRFQFGEMAVVTAAPILQNTATQVEQIDCELFSNRPTDEAHKRHKSVESTQKKHEFPGIAFFNKYMKTRRRNERLKDEASFRSRLINERKFQNLSAKIEQRLNAHGNTLFKTNPSYPRYAELRHSMDKDRPVFYPFTFSFTSLTEIERRAIQGNFDVHKNLMRLLFNRYSKRVASRNAPGDSQPASKPQRVLTAPGFISLVKFISPVYANYDQKMNTLLFQFITSRFRSGLSSKSAIVFPQFRPLIAQFAYAMHCGPLKENNPFECFQELLANVKETLEDQLVFENDEILNVNVDRQLLSHYQELLKADPETPLPQNFHIRKVRQYESAGKKVEPNSKESKVIVSSILKDVFLAAFDIRFDSSEIRAVERLIVVQEKPIDHQFGDSELPGYAVSAKKDQNRLAAKAEDCNNYLHKKALKLTNNPIEGLSVPLKLLILNESKTPKSDLLEVANLLEQMLRKVEVFAAGKEVKLDAQTGKLMNSVLLQRRDKNQENLPPIVQRHSSMKLVYHPLKKSGVKKLKSDQNVDEKRTRSLQKVALGKPAEKNSDVTKRIEKYRAEVKERKQRAEQEAAEKEAAIKREIQSLVLAFKSRSIPKLKNYIKEKELQGKQRLQELQSSKLIKPLPETKKPREQTVHQEFQQMMENHKLWEKRLKALWQSNEIINAFTESADELRTMFNTISAKFSAPDLMHLRSDKPYQTWGFRETVEFCKENGIYPELMTQGDIKNARRKALESTSAADQFKFDQFKHFLVQVFAKFKDRQGWGDYELYDAALFSQMLRELRQRKLDKFVSKANKSQQKVDIKGGS